MAQKSYNLSLFKSIPPISIHSDRKSAINLLKPKTNNTKLNRHLRSKFKSIISIFDEHATLNCVKLENNLANYLTKFRNAI